MDIEPLKNLLKNRDDIKEILIDFLPNEDKQKLNHWRYEGKTFYINDRILCMKKNTLEIECNGRISYINNGMIGISLSKYRNICIDPKKYYLFIRNKSEDIKKRDFMKQLLEVL
tara:strand:- start:24530 stop:24871 length:342 start_codon:yes stop_codon:yes gene_type:complete